MNDKEHIEVAVGVGVTSRLGAIDRHVSDTSRVPFHEFTTVDIQPRLFVWSQSHKERLDRTIDIFTFSAYGCTFITTSCVGEQYGP
jgi:hypothetical protein